jgi:hypothetical protein
MLVVKFSAEFEDNGTLSTPCLSSATDEESILLALLPLG